eukprot:jgi/Botrbrau1/15247/Bobra.0149s0097.1
MAKQDVGDGSSSTSGSSSSSSADEASRSSASSSSSSTSRSSKPSSKSSSSSSGDSAAAEARQAASRKGAERIVHKAIARGRSRSPSLSPGLRDRKFSPDAKRQRREEPPVRKRLSPPPRRSPPRRGRQDSPPQRPRDREHHRPGQEQSPRRERSGRSPVRDRRVLDRNDRRDRSPAARSREVQPSGRDHEARRGTGKERDTGKERESGREWANGERSRRGGWSPPVKHSGGRSPQRDRGFPPPPPLPARGRVNGHTHGRGGKGKDPFGPGWHYEPPPTRAPEVGQSRSSRWGQEPPGSGPSDPSAKEGRGPRAGAGPVEPNFGLSGKLAEESNKTVTGEVLKYQEPPEASYPTLRWRLYVFKAGEPDKAPLYLHRKSFWLFGRDRKVVDVPTDHPSCSKQHAVLQYRNTQKEEDDGTTKTAVRPYLMDLGSVNGTYLNAERLEAQRYYELFEKDVIKFGNSTREYVFLHERSLDNV